MNHVRDLVRLGSEDCSLVGHKPHRLKLRDVGDSVSCDSLCDNRRLSFEQDTDAESNGPSVLTNSEFNHLCVDFSARTLWAFLAEQVFVKGDNPNFLNARLPAIYSLYSPVLVTTQNVLKASTHHSPLGNYQWSPWLLRGKQSYWPTTFPRYLHFRRECFHIQMTNKYMKRKCKLKPQCNNTTLPPEQLQWKRLTVIWWGCGTVGARDGNWHNHFGQLCDYLLK